MQKIKRPVLIYHGGKFQLAPWIIANFPKHKCYVECFGGAASVLMRKPRSYAEIYNDKWDDIVDVFRVLREPTLARELQYKLRLTPFSRKEFMECTENNINNTMNLVEKARLTILRSFAGFGSASINAKYATGFRSKAYNLSDWVKYPDHIDSFVQRLKGVVIENKDYKDIINQHDSDETLFYLDPPYVHNTRNINGSDGSYAFEMSDEDHKEMAFIIKKIDGMAVISGYNNDLYRKLFDGWKMIERKAYTNRDVERVECLWLNEKAAKKVNAKLF